MRAGAIGLATALLVTACGTQPLPLTRPDSGAAATQATPTRHFKETKLGKRSYKLYTPPGLDGQRPAPLVVMLHGCKQDADLFAAGTRMNALAAQEKFYVLYPEQNRTANAYQCWNWFLPSNQQRNRGEAHAIAEMVNHVRTQVKVDANAIFCAGLSAGGAMAAIMGATYPDLFRGIAIASGLEYQAAQSVTRAKEAMREGGPPPSEAAQAAYAAMNGAGARVVPTFVIHGSDDAVVNPTNANQALQQWALTNDWALDGNLNGDVPQQPTSRQEAQTPGGHRYTRWQYQNTGGQLLLEKVVVHGMGHAWSGGSPAGNYTDPAGPDASAMIWNFFKQQRQNTQKGR